MWRADKLQILQGLYHVRRTTQVFKGFVAKKATICRLSTSLRQPCSSRCIALGGKRGAGTTPSPSSQWRRSIPWRSRRLAHEIRPYIGKASVFNITISSIVVKQPESGSSSDKVRFFLIGGWSIFFTIESTIGRGSLNHKSSNLRGFQFAESGARPSSTVIISKCWSNQQQRRM